MRRPSIKKLGFKLNMQIIVDDFEQKYPDISFYCKGTDKGNLTGVRIYSEETVVKNSIVYIARAEQLENYDFTYGGSFVVLGDIKERADDSESRLIILDAKNDPVKVLNDVEEVFDHCRKWDMEMQVALNNDLGIDELCKISINYFGNPIFIHDERFYILACPELHEKMSRWEVDERTGRPMTSAALLNDFKIDEEYMGTLVTKGADIFSANQRGYRILYVNLWDETEQWKGRICIAEIRSRVNPGQLLAADYFQMIISLAISKRNIIEGSYERPFEAELKDIIEGHLVEKREIEQRISYNKWKIDDNYLCMKVGMNNREVDIMGAIVTCNHIENQIPGSYAFLYEKNVFVIINMSIAKLNLTECMSKLAIIIREGLFIVGVSKVFNDLSNLPIFYRQACIAHDYGRLTDSTLWWHKYEDYALSYLLDMACKEMPAKEVCMGALIVLKKYDEKNETDLFKTLKVYLEMERNAVHTSKELFIHRSTLFYRLDRIKELTGINIDDHETRLYVNISYKILEKTDF